MLTLDALQDNKCKYLIFQENTRSLKEFFEYWKLGSSFNLLMLHVVLSKQ